jgi:tetratricopeptide (TPR) repeat protein
MVQADLPMMRIAAVAMLALLAVACGGTSTAKRESYPGEPGRVTRPLDDGARTGEATPLPGDAYPPVPEEIPPNVPRRAEEVSGPAVQSLIAQARLSQPEQAIAPLERAQRIEPKNPFVWQMLATSHLALGRMQEAENCAQKSNSLARGNPYIEIENWKVISATRQSAGDVQSALQAQARVDDLSRLLGQR